MEQIRQHNTSDAQISSFCMPSWLMKKDDYQPPADKENFLNKTILSIVAKLSALRDMQAINNSKTFSASFKVFFTGLLILFISLSHRPMFLFIILSVVLVHLCFFDAKYILSILKPALSAAVFSLLIILPAAIFGLTSIFMLPLKVFLTTASIAVLAHTTPFHSITKALGGLHIPGLFIMTIDLTIKYIVLLGSTAYDLLIALKLRSIGKNDQKYQSLGSILGMTFIKSQEYADETHNAMLCRCFTGEYHVSQQHHLERRYIIYAAAAVVLMTTFLCTEGYLVI